MRQQGQGAVPRRRGSQALRQRRQARAVATEPVAFAEPHDASQRRASITCISIPSIPTPRSISTSGSFRARRRRRWNGFPALKSPTNVLILFSKVDAPPPTSPQTAIWHFGWHVVDSRKSLEAYKARPDVKHFPLYTSDEGGTVLISSDTWPAGAALGLTRAEIADAKAKGVQPARERGFAYLQGPDGAIVEYLGNFPAERMNHVHMFQDHPFCAQLWYRKHLDAQPVAGRTSAGIDDRSQLPGAARAGAVVAGDGTPRPLPRRRARRSSSTT